jgi:hypothetical protein
MAIKIVLTDEEKQVVHFLAGRFRKGVTSVAASELPSFQEVRSDRGLVLVSIVREINVGNLRAIG